MQEQMNGQYNRQTAGAYGYEGQAAAGTPKKEDEDYIEFEEIK